MAEWVIDDPLATYDGTPVQLPGATVGVRDLGSGQLAIDAFDDGGANGLGTPTDELTVTVGDATHANAYQWAVAGLNDTDVLVLAIRYGNDSSTGDELIAFAVRVTDGQLTAGALLIVAAPAKPATIGSAGVAVADFGIVIPWGLYDNDAIRQLHQATLAAAGTALSIIDSGYWALTPSGSLDYFDPVTALTDPASGRPVMAYRYISDEVDSYYAVFSWQPDGLAVTISHTTNTLIDATGDVTFAILDAVWIFSLSPEGELIAWRLNIDAANAATEGAAQTIATGVEIKQPDMWGMGGTAVSVIRLPGMDCLAVVLSDEGGDGGGIS